MVESNRRDMLKTTGLGAGLAMGIGGVGTQQAVATRDSMRSSEVTPASGAPEAVFEAVAEEAFIVINGDGPDDEPIELSGDDIEGDITIEGLIFDDGTWQSRNISFPDLDPETLLENFGDELPIDPGSVDGDIDVGVDPIEGEFDREEGLITGDLALSIAADLSVFGIGIDLEIEAEAPMTTEESNGGDTPPIEGDTQNLDGEEAEATLVSNEFEIPATGEEIDIPGVDIDIDEELGLPAAEGRNYLSLSLSLEITDFEDIEGPQLVTTFSADLNEGFITLNEGSISDIGDTSDSNTFEIEDFNLQGEIFDDGTWESTTFEFNIDDDVESLIEEAVSIGGFELASSEVDTVVESAHGDYDPVGQRLTTDVDVTVDAELSTLWGIISSDFTINPNTIHATSEESNALEGSASGLHTESPDTQLVSNDFFVPDLEGGTIIDTISDILFGNIAQPADRNWIDLDLDMTVDNPEAINDLMIFDPVAANPPVDLNGDWLFEDVAGDGGFSSTDVNVLFNNLDSAAVQEQSGRTGKIFAFAGEQQNRDSIGIVDVQALWNAGSAVNWNPDALEEPPAVIVPEKAVDVRLEPVDEGGHQVELGEATELEVIVASRTGDDGVVGPTDGIEVFDFELGLSDSEVATIEDFELVEEPEYDRCDIVDDGNKLVLEGAFGDSLLDDLDENGNITIGTVELVANEEQTGLVTVDPVVAPFPGGVFGDETEPYETAETDGQAVTVGAPASVTLNDSHEQRLGEVVVDAVDPGDFGSYLGIWTELNDEPDERIGYTELETADEEVSVPVDEPANGETLIAAVHPADADGEPLFDEILASSFATQNVTIGPPALTDEPGYDNPQDVDDDGLFEHTTGTGEFSIADVQALFEHLDNEQRVQAYSEFYNFSGLDEDRVTIFDVQALYRRYQEHS